MANGRVDLKHASHYASKVGGRPHQLHDGATGRQVKARGPAQS